MNPATKNFLGSIFVAAALFLFWSFNYTTWGQIPAYRQAIEERRAALAERQGILANLKRYNEEYQTHADEISRFSLLIPTKKDIQYLISSMDAMGTQAGVQVNDILVSEDKGRADITTIGSLNIATNVSGSLEGLLAFIKNLEDNIRLTDLQVLGITRPSADTPVFRFDIRAKTYVVK